MPSFRYLLFLRRGLIFCLLLIALLGFFKVGARAWFETWGSFHSDATVYGTVGRGMLNGLTPYTDLYDNKTPVIYLIIALSFLLTGSMALFSWLQGLVILFLPFAILLPLHLRFGIRSHPVYYLLGFIFGCALSLYSAEFAGQLLPESFGAFFGVLLIGTLFVFERRAPREWIRVAIISVLLLVTIGIKEPFALSIIGATLILIPWRRAFHALALPLGAAVTAGLLGLLILGLLGPYFIIHVGHMLGHHIQTPWGTLGESPWLRFVDVFRLWENMRTYSPFLPWVLFPVWIGALVCTLRAASKKSERLYAGARWIAGSVLTTAAIGLTGDFYGHHFIVAAPLFAAAFFVCIKEISEKRHGELVESMTFLQTSPVRQAQGDVCKHFSEIPKETSFPGKQQLQTAGAAIVTTFCALIFAFAPQNFSSVYASWHDWSQEGYEAALILDTVLERCDVNRYFNFIDRPDALNVFTRHSPLGPLFTQYSRFVGARQEYLEGFSDAMANAPIMVMRTEQEGVPLGAETLQYLRDAFTETPPPCAGSFVQPSPYRILFRKG